MSHTENTTVILTLSENTRKLLKAMHFEAVPEEANYLVFFESGKAQFFEALDLPPYPGLLFVNALFDVPLTF